MTKYKPNAALRRFLDSKPVVVAGYFDDSVKQVNLDSLLGTWFDATQDNETLSDRCPYASDHFQVAVVEADDPRLEKPGILLHILRDFRHAPHLKVWSDGELLDEQELVEMLARNMQSANE